MESCNSLLPLCFLYPLSNIFSILEPRYATKKEEKLAKINVFSICSYFFLLNLIISLKT
jgi:hypothetical protein